MTIEDEILALINAKTLEISANFNSIAHNLTERITANLKNMDYGKYTQLLNRCEKLIQSAEKWETFKEDIQEIKEFKERLEDVFRN